MWSLARLQLAVYQVVWLAILYCAFALLLKMGWFRRGMRRVVVLTRRGPIYRLAAHGARRVHVLLLGKRAYRKPERPPAPRVLSQSSRGVRVRYAERVAGAWGDDEVEVEASVAGGEWRLVDVDAARRVAAQEAPDGLAVRFRCRARNERGESAWSPVTETRSLQEPVDGGGSGVSDDGAPYRWRQTTNLVRVVAKVPPGTRGRDVDVQVTSTHLTAGLRDRAPFFDHAQLRKPVLADSLVWELVDDELVVTVAKMKRSFLAKEHWERLVFGHPPVDTVRIPTSLKQEFED